MNQELQDIYVATIVSNKYKTLTVQLLVCEKGQREIIQTFFFHESDRRFFKLKNQIKVTLDMYLRNKNTFPCHLEKIDKKLALVLMMCQGDEDTIDLLVKNNLIKSIDFKRRII